jgi:HPt (histidine-containing phosphotransfer) domain-containing protein
MDLKMPEMDGLEASEKIRQSEDPKIANIPIIAISAAISSENYDFLMGIGVDTFLEKPFKENELLKQVSKVLAPGKRPIVMNTDSEFSNPKPTKTFDLSELQKQAGDNPNFIAEMLNTLIESTQKGIIQMEHALQQKEWHTINLTAHRLASPLRFIYADELYKLVKELEKDTEAGMIMNPELITARISGFKEKFVALEEFIRDFLKNN